ncbi:MAG: hypothetical protein M3433_00790 [Actinomycetota bacterium]|nr:hypothetical protein [Actinomycetota bacterium]
MSAVGALKPFSLRLRRGTHAELEAHGRARGESKSRVAERLIEEGLRMAAHPEIVFRDGPAGRRASLAGGPDVWELIAAMRDSGLQGEAAVTSMTEWGALTVGQVRAAVRYYGEFTAEVDERIRRNRDEAERQREGWQRAQAALG